MLNDRHFILYTISSSFHPSSNQQHFNFQSIHGLSVGPRERGMASSPFNPSKGDVACLHVSPKKEHKASAPVSPSEGDVHLLCASQSW